MVGVRSKTGDSIGVGGVRKIDVWVGWVVLGGRQMIEYGWVVLGVRHDWVVWMVLGVRQMTGVGGVSNTDDWVVVGGVRSKTDVWVGGVRSKTDVWNMTDNLVWVGGVRSMTDDWVGVDIIS